MPYAATGGTYTNVAGATGVAAGTVIQSAVWDNIHTDVGSALSQVMQQLISGVTYRNALYMNGGFEVWQRGTSIAVAASNTLYTADRWYLLTGANQASTVAQATGLSNGSQFACKVQRNNGQTGTGTMFFGYPLDTDEIYRLRGNKISCSFLIKAGANWSPTSGTIAVNIECGTGALIKRSSGSFTNETIPLQVIQGLTPGGATVALLGSSSVVVPTTTTQMELQFIWTPTGTAGADDSITIDDVQLEPQLATTWTPTNFDRLPFVQQFQLCQKHYCKTFNYATAPAQNVGTADTGAIEQISNGAARVQFYWEYPVRLRTAPGAAGITTYNPGAANANWRDVTAAADLAAVVDTDSDGNEQGVLVFSATAAADAHAIFIHITASAGI